MPARFRDSPKNRKASDYSSSSDNELYPQLQRDLIEEDCSYSEKMFMIAQEIHRITLIDAQKPTGYDNLRLLDQYLADYTGISGEKLADLMGFVSFRAMCLNSAEIAELHTWELKQDDNGQNIITKFCAIIPEEHKQQVSMQPKETIKEKAEVQGSKIIDLIAKHGNFPTDKELAFRYRMCATLDRLGGLKKNVSLSDWIKAHKALHNGEEMNADSYRNFFGIQHQINIQTIISDRFKMEVLSFGKNNSLEFRLLYPLSEIQKYHEKLREVREKHFTQYQIESKLKLERQMKRNNAYAECFE